MPKGDDADGNKGDAFDRLEGIIRTDHPNPKANAYKGYDYADDEKTSVIQQKLGNHCLVTSLLHPLWKVWFDVFLTRFAISLPQCCAPL